MRDQKGDEEYRNEVHEQWRRDPNHRDNLVDDLATLAGEKYKDGVKQANEGPRREILEERPVVPVGAGNSLQRKPCDDGGTQRDSKKHGDANCDG